VLTVTLLPQTGTIAGGWPRLSRCASVDGPRPSPGRVLVMASARDHARGGASHMRTVTQAVRGSLPHFASALRSAAAPRASCRKRSIMTINCYEAFNRRDSRATGLTPVVP